MPVAHQVRLHQPADVQPLAAALARSFFDDPVMGWLFPEPATRLVKLDAFFRLEIRGISGRDGEVYTTPEHAGGALWARPGRWKIGGLEMFRSAPTMLRILGRRTGLALQGLGAVERAHPREDHWYLGVLGTDPPHQGTGAGGALLAPVLSRCDAEGIGAYLESSKERNVPYYARFGFKVTQEVSLPKGPKVWLMWRDPQG